MALARPNLRFSTTLYQAADDSQTTLYPNAVPAVVPCYLMLDPKTETEEIVKVTAKSTNSITVVRAQSGTSATDHSIGAAVVDYNIPQYFDDLADAYEGVFNDDGTPKEDGTLVTLDGEQTLTEKTLTEPTLTNPVINTGISGTAIVDEDDMASDSDTKVPTQQSVKAYVDAEVTGVTPPGLSSKVGSVTRDMATATGTVAITGIGFQPTSIHFYAVLAGTTDSRGFVDSSRAGVGITRVQTSTYLPMAGFGANTVIALEPGSGSYQQATVSSYDADGFTLSWTKVGSPTGTATIVYIAYK